MLRFLVGLRLVLERNMLFEIASSALYKAPHNFAKGKILMTDSDQIKEIELEVQGMT